MSLDDLLPDSVLPQVVPRGEYLLIRGEVYEWVDRLIETKDGLMYSLDMELIFKGDERYEER